MLNIRLSRVGKKGHAQYRIVVAEKSSPIKGKSVEQIGSYDPHSKKLIVKNDRVDYWISNGAACSDTVKNLFIEKGIIEGDKVKMTFRKKEEEGADDAKEKKEGSDTGEKDVKKDDIKKEDTGGSGSDEKQEKEEDAKKEDTEKEAVKSEKNKGE